MDSESISLYIIKYRAMFIMHNCYVFTTKCIIYLYFIGIPAVCRAFCHSFSQWFSFLYPRMYFSFFFGIWSSHLSSCSLRKTTIISFISLHHFNMTHGIPSNHMQPSVFPCYVFHHYSWSASFGLNHHFINNEDQSSRL